MYISNMQMLHLPLAISGLLEYPFLLALLAGAAVALLLIGVGFCVVAGVFVGLRGNEKAQRGQRYSEVSANPSRAAKILLYKAAEGENSG